MKILLVVPDYPPKSSGGGGRVAKILAEGLKDNGHDVTVLAGFCNNIEKNYYEEIINDVKIVWIPLMNIFVKRMPQFVYSFPPKLSSFKFLLSFDYVNYDVIHLFAYPTHLFVDIVALISKNKKFILTIHAFPDYVDSGPASPILKILYHIYLSVIGPYIIKNCNIVTTISEYTRKEAISHNFPSENIVLISNGINLEQDIIKETVKKDDFVIVSIGRITWYKGFEYALVAIRDLSKNIKNLKYIIIGETIDYSYLKKLKDLICEYGLGNNVIFTGRINEDMKLCILYNANIYLAPSTHEGFGLTLLEAMKYKIPIIATDTTGHRDIVKNMETAIMVEIKNSEEIARAIKLINSNEELRYRLIKNSTTEIKKYEWVNIIARYENLYKSFKK